MLNGVFQDLYEILVRIIFNGDVASSPIAQFWCNGIAIVACTFLVALPFLIVWRIIRRFM